MAVGPSDLNNTFHEPFINVLVAKINNLKTKIVIKLKIPMIYTKIYLDLKIISSKITETRRTQDKLRRFI